MTENNTRSTVMVVEDFADTRLMLEQWLSRRGFRVVHAKDGWEAVGVAVRERPDLILMDLNLPVLDGVEVTCLLREHEELRDVPIVAITAHDTAEARADASDAGCNAYIAKPVDFDELDRVVRQILPG